MIIDHWWIAQMALQGPTENKDRECVPKSGNKIKPVKIYFPLDERIPPNSDPGHRDSR